MTGNNFGNNLFAETPASTAPPQTGFAYGGFSAPAATQAPATSTVNGAPPTYTDVMYGPSSANYNVISQAPPIDDEDTYILQPIVVQNAPYTGHLPSPQINRVI